MHKYIRTIGGENFLLELCRKCKHHQLLRWCGNSKRCRTEYYHQSFKVECFVYTCLSFTARWIRSTESIYDCRFSTPTEKWKRKHRDELTRQTSKSVTLNDEIIIFIKIFNTLHSYRYHDSVLQSALKE